MSDTIGRLSLGLRVADKIALRILAGKEGEPMSLHVRRLLRHELKRRGVTQDGNREALAVQRDMTRGQEKSHDTASAR